MLLALALADHAHDDGTRIYPSVKQLSKKTRQAERTIQYQLRKMEESGWLILENEGHGGRGMHRSYRISPDWINGAELAPLKKGATDDGKGAIHDKKGATDDGKGCKAFAPAYTHHEPSLEPSENHPSQTPAEIPAPSVPAVIAPAVPAVAEDANPVVLKFPLNDGTTYDLTQTEVDQFASLYPAIDVMSHLRACLGWSITNPPRRKTRKGILSHINTWLADKQNKAPTQQQQQPQQSAWQKKQEREQAFIDRLQGKPNANLVLKDIN